MRLLHTSDWHLGRSFHQVGLLPAQEMFVDHLVDVVRDEGVGVVLVAGDVYDRAQPAPQTVELLSDTLTRLTDAGTQVVLTSGNHDSAVRLGFAGRLLERSGVHLRTTVADIDRPVEVGGARIYGIPYLEPSVVADTLGAGARTHAGVLRAATARIRSHAAGFDGPVVVAAHAFVAGGIGSDSERDIAVGGVAGVPVEVFDGFTYTALGHLHGRQRLADTVHYSGSPVAMSFSEAGHTKATLLVDVPATADGAVYVTPVPTPVHTPLALLRGDLDDLLADPALAHAETAYCQVTLTDAVRPLGAIDRVRARFPRTLSLQFDPVGAPATTRRTYSERVRVADDAQICRGFLEHVRGGNPPSDAEATVLAAAVEGARLAAREDHR